MARLPCLPIAQGGRRRECRMNSKQQQHSRHSPPVLPVPSFAHSIQSVKAALLRVLLVETDLRDRQMGRRTKADDFESDEE